MSYAILFSLYFMVLLAIFSLCHLYSSLCSWLFFFLFIYSWFSTQFTFSFWRFLLLIFSHCCSTWYLRSITTELKHRNRQKKNMQSKHCNWQVMQQIWSGNERKKHIFFFVETGDCGKFVMNTLEFFKPFNIGYSLIVIYFPF